MERKHERMIKKYGAYICVKVVWLHEELGQGSRTMSDDLDYHENTIIAMSGTGHAIREHDEELFYNLVEQIEDEGLR